MGLRQFLMRDTTDGRNAPPRMPSCYMVLLPKEAYFLADCAVNIESDADRLAETALLTARMVRLLGIEPRVAMLSFSNFGAVDHPLGVA